MSGLVGMRIHGVTYAAFLLNQAVQLLVPWVVCGVSTIKRSLLVWDQLVKQRSWNWKVLLSELLDLAFEIKLLTGIVRGLS